MNILDLPDCMLEDIFEYLNYDEIAKKRLVSKKVNRVCQSLLNRGFSKMVRRHTTILKRIKALLPRRESERRTHPMARHADILTCVETRISMLSMTYTKYMDLHLCCFIPGKIIDEVFRILNLIESTNKPLRAFEVLQELRDISSMAIEHFDDKLSCVFKRSVMDFTTLSHIRHSIGGSSTSSSGCSLSSSNTPTLSGRSSNNNDERLMASASQLRQYMTGLPNSDDNSSVLSGSSNSNLNNSNIMSPIQSPTAQLYDRYHKCNEAASNHVLIKKLEAKYNGAIKKFNRMILIQNKQAKQLRENSVTISEMNAQIVELKRRIEITKTNRNVVVDMTTPEIKIHRTISNLEFNSSIGSNSGGNDDEQQVQPPPSPRTATLILKRRITEGLDTNTSSSNSLDDNNYKILKK